MTTNAITISIPELGLTFSSMGECAKHFRVSWNTVNYHLNRGTLHKIGASARPHNNCHPITINGVTYPSRTAAQLALGVCQQHFYRTLHAGKYDLSPAQGTNQRKEK